MKLFFDAGGRVIATTRLPDLSAELGRTEAVREGVRQVFGAEAALPIWAATMTAAVRQTPPKPFTPPPGVVLVSVDRETGASPSFWCDRALMVEEAFRAGTEPATGCGGGALVSAGRGILNWLGRLFR